MTTANDNLKSIQSRIDELEQTVSEREEQIKTRTKQLKDDLQEELSPAELIRKHPLEAAGVSFVTGLVAGRIVRSMLRPRRSPSSSIHATPVEIQPSTISSTLSIIGVELLHTVRDIAVSWIKNRIDEKRKNLQTGK